MKAIRIEEYRNTLSDENAIKRILLGEKELYELLMRRHNQMLFRVVIGYLKDQDEVADVMQDTYIKAYEKLYQFKHDASFSTWLIRIGINEALARLKEKGKYFKINERNEAVQDRILQIPEPHQPNPEKKMVQQEMKQLLERAIGNLDPKYRLVYLMKEVEGMSISEISECLDLPISNVKVRVHRAKAMLKEKLYAMSNPADIFEFGSKSCDALVEKVMGRI